MQGLTFRGPAGLIGMRLRVFDRSTSAASGDDGGSICVGKRRRRVSRALTGRDRRSVTFPFLTQSMCNRRTQDA